MVIIFKFPLFVILTFFCIIQYSYGEGRRCFVCKGEGEDESLDNCKISGTICPFDIHVCSKSIANTDDNKTVVVRDCAFSNAQKEGCSNFENPGAKYKICYCDEDNCNSSGILLESTVTIIVMIFSLIVWSFSGFAL